MKYLLTLAASFLVLNFCGAQPATAPVTTEVTVFLAFECPISQKYIPTLNKLYAEYNESSAVSWLFVVPGKTDRDARSQFIKEFGVNFPIQFDPKYELVASSSATITPEIIIRQGEVLYRGAIDNWFYELGKYRQKITDHYAADALAAIVKGGRPEVKSTEAIGCPIASPKKNDHAAHH